jgi:transcription termination factor NusB
VKKRAEGKSERQIAEEVGCSKSKVNKVINSTGQKRPVDLPTEVIGKDGKKRKARKTECEQKIVELAQAGLGATAISKQTGLSRSAVRARLGKIALDTIQSEVDALPAHCEEAKQVLSLTAQQKLDKAIELFEQQKLVEMQKEFQEELSKAVADKQASLDALIEKKRQEDHAVKELRKQLEDARSTVDRLMTYEEFKIVRGLLHPDRYPDDLKERAGKAFDIFNRLEKCVNPNIGIAELRKRGWDHLSPYGRRKAAV